MMEKGEERAMGGGRGGEIGPTEVGRSDGVEGDGEGGTCGFGGGRGALPHATGRRTQGKQTQRNKIKELLTGCVLMKGESEMPKITNKMQKLKGIVYAVIVTEIVHSIISYLYSSAGSLWHRLGSTSYVVAARFDPTDIFLFPAMMFHCLFITFLWVGYYWGKDAGDNRKSKMVSIDSGGSASQHENTIQSAQKEAKESGQSDAPMSSEGGVDWKVVLQKTWAVCFPWGQYFLNVCCTTWILFMLLLHLIAHDRWDYFHRSCLKVRPFISEYEYHLLRRRWVMMSSKTDYLSIMAIK